MINGMIAWFARNSVAANLMMIFIILMGVNGIVNRLPVEVFPMFSPDEVEIRVTYRGATPEQMEESIVIPLENIVADLPGIEEIKSSAREGSARIEIEAETGYDPRVLLEDVKSRVDSINSLPEGIEPPVVRVEEHLHEVVTLIIHGNMSEYDLRKLGERIRDDVGRLEGISRVEMRGLRNYEINIEVSETILQEHRLTLQQVAEAVRNSAVDMPGGSIKARNGEVLVRTEGRAFDKAAFEKIIIKARIDGSHLTLGEISNITDAFEEEQVVMRFNGSRCAVVHIARTGDQNALKIEGIVKGYLDNLLPSLPEGVSVDIWNNRADIINKRVGTLNDSAYMGIASIIILLGLFLRPAVAFWVCLGVPIAFMGAFSLMPYLGVTINVLTLYGFILVLGILVDDAIVTGERIHTFQQRGGTILDGAIKGAQEVATPVIFGVLTTAIAFVPLLLVEGRRGQIFAQIPLVVIPCLLFSLVESKLILPAHLGHSIKQGTFERLKQLLLWGCVPGYLLGSFFSLWFIKAIQTWFGLEEVGAPLKYIPFALVLFLVVITVDLTIRILLKGLEKVVHLITNIIYGLLLIVWCMSVGLSFSGVLNFSLEPWLWPIHMWGGFIIALLIIVAFIPTIQNRFAEGLKWGIDRIYRPVLDTASTNRYVTLSIFLSAAIIIGSYSYFGGLRMKFFPDIDSEYATARLVMPQGTAYEVTEEKLQKMIKEAYALKKAHEGDYLDPESGKMVKRSVVGDIITTIGGQNIAGVRGSAATGVANLGEVQMQLMAPEDRIYFIDKNLHHIKTRELVKKWRKNIGHIQGAQEITTKGVIGRSRDPVAIKLAMPALDTSEETTAALAEVSGQIKSNLLGYQGLFDIHDTFERTKEEVRPKLKPDAMQRGLTRAIIGRQVQGGFFGHEAQRIQGGQNEVRVMVRYPIKERENIASLENMQIRLPEGGSAPLTSVATLDYADSYPSIYRNDMARTLYVLADADKDNAALDLEKVREDLEPKAEKLTAAQPGMTYEFVGEGRERKESFAALRLGSIIILLGIYGMLAIPFKSYTQPFIVMAIIPFSIMGALLGHMIMDIPFSVMSAFGMLAMAGVVVNDSLVMVHYINLKRDEGIPLAQAVSQAGGARFRPILLTSLTTFGGILPSMFENSTQAQFVIPMGISLAWGVLFATFITLILVPICYLILEDIKGGISRYWNMHNRRKSEPVTA